MKLDGVIAMMAGLMLYGAAAGLEIVLGTGPKVSAILEETGKAILLLMFGWSGIRGRNKISNTAQVFVPQPLRLVRSRALGVARRLSLGLVAVAVFAGAENLAYLIAFQESGVLARLLWSLPVHLVAALAEAFGVLFLFRWFVGERNIIRRFVGFSSWIGMGVLAMAWHIAANFLVSDRLASSTFTGGVVIANLLFLILLMQFLRQAYLGGFLHGAD